MNKLRRVLNAVQCVNLSDGSIRSRGTYEKFISNKLKNTDYFKIIIIMDFKENTKKIRYSNKKGSKITRFEAEGQHYLWSGSTAGYYSDITLLKGIITIEEEPRFIYYTETVEEFDEMSKSYKTEIDLLFKNEGKYYCNHPFIKLTDKNREELNEHIESEEFELFSNKFSEFLYELDKRKYPTITWILSNCRDRCPNVDSPEFMERWNQETKFINEVIRQTAYYNQNLKKFIKIIHPKVSEYKLRANYRGKSENAKENKSRNWRKNKENDRRRKQRRETKKSIKNDI